MDAVGNSKEEYQYHCSRLGCGDRGITNSAVLAFYTGQSRFQKHLFSRKNTLPDLRQRIETMKQLFDTVNPRGPITVKHIILAYHQVMEKYQKYIPQHILHVINENYVAPMLESLFSEGHLDEMFPFPNNQSTTEIDSDSSDSCDDAEMIPPEAPHYLLPSWKSHFFTSKHKTSGREELSFATFACERIFSCGFSRLLHHFYQSMPYLRGARGRKGSIISAMTTEAKHK